MLRRIITNVVLAFTLIPTLNFGISFVRIVIIGDPRSPTSFGEMVSYMAMMYTVYTPILFLLFILLPYNLLLLYKNRKERFSLRSKFFLFMAVIFAGLIFVSFLTLIWSPKLINNLYTLIVLSVVAYICVSVIHHYADTRSPA